MWETGCTILNLTDLSFAFVVPPLAERAAGPASVPTMRSSSRPLSGKQYLTAFGHESEYREPVHGHMAMHGAMRHMHGAM